jgi:hypothetical protein
MQKRISFLLTVFTLLCVMQSRAQLFVGVEAGANRNYLISNTSDKPFFEYQPSYGYSVGASVRYTFPKLSSWFGGIQAVPTFMTKNYRIQRTGEYSAMYQQTDNTYLQLPVMAQFRFGGHLNKAQTLHGILNLGGYGAYWMSSHSHGRAMSPFDSNENTYQTFDSKYEFQSQKDNRIEFGAVAGVGLQYALQSKYIFSVEYRYTPSLTDQQKAYQADQVPRYNETHGILVSMQYQLPALKHGTGAKRK